MTTSQKTYKLGANATDMNTAKDQNTFFFKLEKQRGYQNMTKHFVDDKHIVRTQK